MSKFQFDVQKAIATAWDALWAKNLRERKQAKHDRWANRTYYICAVDIENQVRAWADDTANGRPWDMKNLQYGRPCVRVRFRGNLQRTVRDWLFRNPKITYHNFGRGHISGARFRPVGEPLGPSEIKAREKHAKPYTPKPKHYSRHSHSGRAACVEASAKARGKRIFGWRNSKASTTRDKAEVTCARCLKLKGWEAVETTNAVA